MNEQVDARGLSCPQPVMLAEKKMQQLESGDFEILVNTEAARENICRLAKNKGWEVKIIPQGSEYRLVLKKE